MFASCCCWHAQCRRPLTRPPPQIEIFEEKFVIHQTENKRLAGEGTVLDYSGMVDDEFLLRAKRRQARFNQLACAVMCLCVAIPIYLIYGGGGDEERQDKAAEGGAAGE